MAKNRKGMNKHQKAIFKPGDHRVRQEDIMMYLEMSQSSDADERLEAADNLCPCHVRRPMPEIKEALYRMMEDPDVRVRRAAWHTLEDGGVPDDPELDPIFERAMDNESDRMIRSFIREFAEPRIREKKELEFQRSTRTSFTEQGKCDFCGKPDVAVKRDFETEIPTESGIPRLAWICEACDGLP